MLLLAAQPVVSIRCLVWKTIQPWHKGPGFVSRGTYSSLLSAPIDYSRAHTAENNTVGGFEECSLYCSGSPRRAAWGLYFETEVEMSGKHVQALQRGLAGGAACWLPPAGRGPKQGEGGTGCAVPAFYPRLINGRWKASANAPLIINRCVQAHLGAIFILYGMIDFWLITLACRVVID